MKAAIKEAYLSTYGPLLREFAIRVNNRPCKGVPEPFLPVYGKFYESAATRIAFVGMETRGWGDTSDLLTVVQNNLEEAVFSSFEGFDELHFCSWGNNFGRSFWDFNFKFLAAFYEIADWQEVKRKKHETILRSFAWCNINSVESYQVTAQKRGVEYNSWLTVKEASRPLDSAKFVLDVLQPDIMIILNWDADEDWLTEGLTTSYSSERVSDHLHYYYLPDYKTHVLWTAHPTWLGLNKDFDQHIKEMVALVKHKQTGTS